MRELITKNRTVIGIAAVGLAVLVISWNLFSATVGHSLQQSLIKRASSAINGKLQAGDVDISIFGWVKVANVAVYDTKGKLLAKTPLLKISWRFSDLWNGDLGVQSVENVEVVQAEIWLKEKNNTWSMQQVVPDKKSATKFRGNVKLIDTKIHVESAATINKTVEKVTGSINFISYPNLLIDLQGKIGKSDLRIAGNWGENIPGKLAITVDPQSLFTGLKIQPPLQIEAQTNGQQTPAVISGTFKMPGLIVQDMNITGTNGSFRYADSRLIIKQAKGAVYGGAITADGEILTNGQVELDLSGSGLDSSQLTDKDVQGPLDFIAHTSGNKQYITNGTFIIYNGKVYGISFHKMTGRFSKQGEATQLSNIAVQTAVGTFYPEQLTKEAISNMPKYKLPTSQPDIEQTVKGKLLNKLLR